MAFTYTDTLLTDRDKVRFEIGDTVEDAGPKPTSANFTDNEVAAIVTAEGSWGKAAARLCEVLAAMWAAEAGTVKIADMAESYSDRSKLFAEKAKDLRAKHGGYRTVTQVAPTRVDGFSDDLDAEDV